MTLEQWVYEYQKLLTNVRWWVRHGQSEHAVKAIDEMQQRWAEFQAEAHGDGR